MQVRSAYRRRGWGFTDPQQISQCAKEGFVEKLKAQEGEGCHMWGTLAVNKARLANGCDPLLSWMQALHTYEDTSLELLPRRLGSTVQRPPNMARKGCAAARSAAQESMGRACACTVLCLSVMSYVVSAFRPCYQSPPCAAGREGGRLLCELLIWTHLGKALCHAPEALPAGPSACADPHSLCQHGLRHLDDHRRFAP